MENKFPSVGAYQRHLSSKPTKHKDIKPHNLFLSASTIITHFVFTCWELKIYVVHHRSLKFNFNTFNEFEAKVSHVVNS